MWRFCRNSLPVRNLLRGRGVLVSVGCSLCVGDIEHVNHLFLDCQFAQDCWSEVNLNYNDREEEYAHEWFLNMLSKAPNDVLIRIATVLWDIWFVRNKRVFKNRLMSAAFGIQWSRKQVEEWQIANKKYGSVQVYGEQEIQLITNGDLHRRITSN
ncbi:uncharacterized protein LOC135147251 [Daucus carota subsp. sativus]|uniref:uncharacterized protein LOC135147251 n=1 Tax=Daucus carota subsp. sativus TaxID=79200 RepID=UPI00308399A7